MTVAPQDNPAYLCNLRVMELFQLLRLFPQRALSSHLGRKLSDFGLLRQNTSTETRIVRRGQVNTAVTPQGNHTSMAETTTQPHVRLLQRSEHATWAKGKGQESAHRYSSQMKLACLETFVFGHGLACDFIRGLKRLLRSRSILLQRPRCLRALCRQIGLSFL